MMNKSLIITFYVLLWRLAFGQEDDVIYSGQNVCLDQKLETKLINVSYLEAVRVKETVWCLQIIPRCSKWTNKLETKYKLQNATRRLNIRRCCDGYVYDGSDPQNTCVPQCVQRQCVFGDCIEPETCRCYPGYSGLECKDLGCPDPDMWGDECSKQCQCQNGASCNPKDGSCNCLPGYRGLHCQDRCDFEHYGSNCTEKCQCGIGMTCHHITGDCIPCQAGFFGVNCSLPCRCNEKGTALCHYETGHCFCKPNYFELLCDRFCPFGYVNETCHTESVDGGCSCPNTLFRCDPERGCVCKDGGHDCEDFFNFSSLTAVRQNSETVATSSSSDIAVALSTLLLIALIIAVLALLYYRRRFQRADKDLQTRRVFYAEGEITPPSLAENYDLIVTNRSPLENEYVVLNNTVPNKTKDTNNVFSTVRDINLYEEINSPSKEKNNEKLAEFYKKDGKTQNINVILNDPLQHQRGAVGFDESEQERQELKKDLKF